MCSEKQKLPFNVVFLEPGLSLKAILSIGSGMQRFEIFTYPMQQGPQQFLQMQVRAAQSNTCNACNSRKKLTNAIINANQCI